MGADHLRLGLVQMTSGDDLDANLAAVERLVREGAAAGAELIAFPENTLHLRTRPGEPPRAPGEGDLTRLAALAADSGVSFLLTTAVADQSRFKNATLAFEPGRAPRVVYEKIHLFDVDVPGAPAVRESATFEPGAAPALIELAGWRLGLSICYDVRFAELYRGYAQAADLILVPSAFLVPTGRAHWHVLLRARAIEAQAYLAAPAQVGPHGTGEHRRETFGHALVVDAWGEVCVDLGEAVGVRVIELERARITRVRAQIPMADHRRLC